MINYQNTAMYQPFSNYNQNYQNNYNYNSLNNYNQNYFNSNYYSQENNINNITNNYYNNSLNYPCPYTQTPAFWSDFPTMPQQQTMFSQQQMYQQPQQMYQSQQMMFPQQQMYQQPQQQDNTSSFVQQLIMMLLPMFLGNNTQETCTEETTVDDNSSAWGDPHFKSTGKDGKTAIKFDQKGKVGDTYNVFKGDGYEVDARYDSYPTGYAIMGEAKVKAGADTIDVTKDGKTTINGKVIKDGSDIKLNDGTHVIVKGATTTIESKDKDGAKINIVNGGGYLNIDPTGKFNGLGGILGTAIDQNKNLTEEECEKFNVTNTKKKIA